MAKEENKQEENVPQLKRYEVFFYISIKCHLLITGARIEKTKL
ncbi:MULTISPECIES: hypothetical protein [Lactiplantibacillus]|nr:MULTISPECIES: hypothetical protein [Lactiplantibacillus]